VLFTAALTLGLCLFVLPVVLSDGEQLLHIVAGIRPLMLILLVTLTLLSYAAMARSYQGIANAAGCRLTFGEWVRLTFVSATVNFLVTSAGLSGFAVRMYLLAQRGVPSGRAVLISLVQTFLTNFTLLIFIVTGFAVVVLRGTLAGTALIAASALVIVFAATLAYAILLVSHRRLRRRTLFFMADAGHRVLRRIVPRWTPGRVRLWRFQHNLNGGLEFLLARKRQIVGPACWILLDWAFTLGVIWLAFRSVNYPIAPGLVVIGFAVGICLSLVSLVPGGIGVMESSMTAVFVSLGVPLETAVVAVLIFRVAYYLLPLLTSLFLFHGVMAQVAHGMAGAARPRFDTPLPPPI